MSAGHDPRPPGGGSDGGRRFGFRSASEVPPVPQPHEVQLELAARRAQRPPAPPFELSWFLALVTGFGGCLVGALVGFPGAPMVGAAFAFLPLWLRIVRGGKVAVAALAAVAWMVGCVGAGAGMGFEGLDARLAGAVPLAPAYLRLVPLDPGLAPTGLARWGSAVPALLTFWLVAGLGRFAQGLASVFAASVPAAWMAVRAARFGAMTREEGAEASRALLFGVAPQHLLVLAGALAVAAVLGSPRGERGFPPVGSVERRVYLVGMAAALVGLLGEPWLDALWRGLAAG